MARIPLQNWNKFFEYFFSVENVVWAFSPSRNLLHQIKCHALMNSLQKVLDVNLKHFWRFFRIPVEIFEFLADNNRKFWIQIEGR